MVENGCIIRKIYARSGINTRTKPIYLAYRSTYNIKCRPTVKHRHDVFSSIVIAIRSTAIVAGPSDQTPLFGNAIFNWPKLVKCDELTVKSQLTWFPVLPTHHAWRNNMAIMNNIGQIHAILSKYLKEKQHFVIYDVFTAIKSSSHGTPILPTMTATNRGLDLLETYLKTRHQKR